MIVNGSLTAEFCSLDFVWVKVFKSLLQRRSHALALVHRIIDFFHLHSNVIQKKDAKKVSD